VETIPTIGFNTEGIKWKGTNFLLYDVGGDAKIRGLWKYYTLHSAGVLFVIDSADPECIDEAAQYVVVLFLFFSFLFFSFLFFSFLFFSFLFFSLFFLFVCLYSYLYYFSPFHISRTTMRIGYI